jgi:hypothetical protein
MTYFEKLKDPRWQKKRLDVLERDGWRCRDCKTDSASLQVHHCKYVKGDPWDTPDFNLMAVCESCHLQRQSLEREIKDFFADCFSNTDVKGLQNTVGMIHRADASEGRERIKLILIDTKTGNELARKKAVA